MSIGPDWNHSCLKSAVVAVLGPIIGASSKASSGCSKPERVGETCPRNIPAPALAGGDCASGKSRTFGLKYGDSSCLNWTKRADWTGANRFWTAALLRPKKGALRRQDQTRQRHEGDGGGRRPGCSFGKPTGLGLAGRSNSGRKHVGANPCAAKTRAS